MIEISLVGAPGSGKTALAESVSAAYFEGKKPKKVIVDKYAERLEKLDLAVGAFADNYINNWIHYLREEEEIRMVGRKVPIMISCGSILETVAYAQIRIEEMNVLAPQGQQERAMVEWQLLCHYATFILNRKDLLYLLPLRGEGAPLHKKLLDLNIKAKLGIPLLAGTLDENTRRIQADIERMEGR